MDNVRTKPEKANEKLFQYFDNWANNNDIGYDTLDALANRVYDDWLPWWECFEMGAVACSIISGNDKAAG